MTKSNSTVNAVYIKLTPDHSKQTDEHEVVIKREKKFWRRTGDKTFHYQSRSKTTGYLFLKCSKELDRMPDTHPNLINLAEHRTDLLNENVRPGDSATYQVGPTDKKFDIAETGKMINRELIDPTATAWGTPIAFDPKVCGSLRFCNDYRKLNVVNIGIRIPSLPLTSISTA